MVLFSSSFRETMHFLPRATFLVKLVKPNLRSGPIERFSYILSNGYRWNWAWYKLLQVCARYGQILAVMLIGC